MAATTTQSTPQAVAFHYGDAPPWDELQAFDLVVVGAEARPLDSELVGQLIRVARQGLISLR